MEKANKQGRAAFAFGLDVNLENPYDAYTQNALWYEFQVGYLSAANQVRRVCGLPVLKSLEELLFILN